MKHSPGKTKLKLILLLMTGAALNACVSVLPKTEPPAPRYTMSAVTVEPGNAIEGVLLVDDPTASQLYQSVKVALSREPNRFEFYAGVEWTDRAPELFQRAMIRSFENAKRMSDVGDHAEIGFADYTLKTDIRAFHVNTVGSPSAVLITILGKLQNNKGQTIGVREFVRREQVDADSVSGVMAGFHRALNGLQREMVNWTFEQIPATSAIDTTTNGSVSGQEGSIEEISLEAETR